MGEDKLKEIMMSVLDKEDCENLVCGLPYKKAMECEYANGLYNYCEKTGSFEWKREIIKGHNKKELLGLYLKIKKVGTADDTRSKAELLNTSQEKRCYYKCKECNYNRVAKEDIFCPKYGKRLIYDDF